MSPHQEGGCRAQGRLSPHEQTWALSSPALRTHRYCVQRGAGRGGPGHSRAGSRLLSSCAERFPALRTGGVVANRVVQGVTITTYSIFMTFEKGNCFEGLRPPALNFPLGSSLPCPSFLCLRGCCPVSPSVSLPAMVTAAPLPTGPHCHLQRPRAAAQLGRRLHFTHFLALFPTRGVSAAFSPRFWTVFQRTGAKSGLCNERPARCSR